MSEETVMERVFCAFCQITSAVILVTGAILIVDSSGLAVIPLALACARHTFPVQKMPLLTRR